MESEFKPDSAFTLEAERLLNSPCPHCLYVKRFGTAFFFLQRGLISKVFISSNLDLSSQAASILKSHIAHCPGP